VKKAGELFTSTAGDNDHNLNLSMGVVIRRFRGTWLAARPNRDIYKIPILHEWNFNSDYCSCRTVVSRCS